MNSELPPDKLREMLEFTMGAKPKNSCLKCNLPAEPGKRRCAVHVEASLPPDDRARMAAERRATWDGIRTRGSSLCASCGLDTPPWYKTGARCKSCNILDVRSRNWNMDDREQAALLALSKGVCMICGKHQIGRALSVDHRHSDNVIRGLLCGIGGNSCNEIIGLWFDDPMRFLRTVVYLIGCPADKALRSEERKSKRQIAEEIVSMLKQILNEDLYN